MPRPWRRSRRNAATSATCRTSILPEALQYEADLGAAVRGADIVLIVVPSDAFAAMLDALAPLLDPGTAIAWATKGFEPGTGRFLHELVAAKLPGRPAAVVTGPSFAREVASRFAQRSHRAFGRRRLRAAPGQLAARARTCAPIRAATCLVPNSAGR